MVMLKNTEQAYGWAAIVLHWLMALVAFFMFGLGLYMVELTYYDAWYNSSVELHKSLGIVLFLLFIFRLFWRVVNIQPVSLSKTLWEARVAHYVHRFLYVLLLLLFLAGYFISTAKGVPVSVFSLFEVPALPWQLEQQEDLAGEVHEILAWLFILTVAFHALAALKHHFVDKDSVLLRMLKVNDRH